MFYFFIYCQTQLGAGHQEAVGWSVDRSVCWSVSLMVLYRGQLTCADKMGMGMGHFVLC